MRMRTGRNRLKYTILVLFTTALAVLVYVAPHVKSEEELIIYDVHADSPRIVKDDGSIDHPRIMTNYRLTGW